MATMNISLPAQMKVWVEQQADSGRYGNASDYVRDLIRKDQERRDAIERIQAAVDVGLQSGVSTLSKEELLRDIRLRAGVDDGI